MEIAAFKVKSRNLPVLTFVHSNLNIWSYRSPIDANSIVWIHDSKVYKRSKFQPKTMSYEGDMIFQRWHLSSASKQVLWRNESKLRSEASKHRLCRQSMSKFDIKTGVVVYELVKQLSLIIVADLRY